MFIGVAASPRHLIGTERYRSRRVGISWSQSQANPCDDTLRGLGGKFVPNAVLIKEFDYLFDVSTPADVHKLIN